MVTKKTKTMSMIAGLTLLVSFVVFFGLLYLTSSQEAMLSERMREQAASLATFRQLDALAGLVQETEVERAELTSYVLTESSVIDFLALIESLAAEQGVSIDTQSLSVDTHPTNAAFEVLQLNTRTEGSYGRVVHMLELMESLPYQVVVRDVVLERIGGGNNWQGIYSLEVTQQPGS